MKKLIFLLFIFIASSQMTFGASVLGGLTPPVTSYIQTSSTGGYYINVRMNYSNWLNIYDNFGVLQSDNGGSSGMSTYNVDIPQKEIITSDGVRQLFWTTSSWSSSVANSSMLKILIFPKDGSSPKVQSIGRGWGTQSTNEYITSIYGFQLNGYSYIRVNGRVLVGGITVVNPLFSWDTVLEEWVYISGGFNPSNVQGVLIIGGYGTYGGNGLYFRINSITGYRYYFKGTNSIISSQGSVIVLRSFQALNTGVIYTDYEYFNDGTSNNINSFLVHNFVNNDGTVNSYLTYYTDTTPNQRIYSYSEIAGTFSGYLYQGDFSYLYSDSINLYKLYPLIDGNSYNTDFNYSFASIIPDGIGGANYTFLSGSTLYYNVTVPIGDEISFGASVINTGTGLVGTGILVPTGGTNTGTIINPVLSDFSFLVSGIDFFENGFSLNNFIPNISGGDLYFDIIAPDISGSGTINLTTGIFGPYQVDGFGYGFDSSVRVTYPYHQVSGVYQVRVVYKYQDLVIYPFGLDYNSYIITLPEITAVLDISFKTLTCEGDPNSTGFLPGVSVFFSCTTDFVSNIMSMIGDAFVSIKGLFDSIGNLGNTNIKKQLFEAFNFDIIPFASANSGTYTYSSDTDVLKIIGAGTFEDIPLLNNIYNLVKYVLLLLIFMSLVVYFFKTKEND